MNGGGNWLFGLLIVAALATQYPTAAVIIAGLFLLEFLVRWGYRRVWAAQTPFKFADPIEQGLRRGSQALALMLLEPLVAFQFYNGSSGAFPNSADILARPTDYWPLLVFAGLTVVGAVRLYAGAPMVLGARDSAAWFKGALRFAAGVAALVVLVRLDITAQVDPPFGGMIAFALFAASLWLALVGLARVALLSWPRGWALGLVREHIEETEFKWGDW
jgi:hypothetical protein